MSTLRIQFGLKALLVIFLFPLSFTIQGCVNTSSKAVQEVINNSAPGQAPGTNIDSEKAFAYSAPTIECLNGDGLQGHNKNGKGECYEMSNQDLRDSDFSNTNLRGANLHSSDLRNANLENADLTGADLTDAKLDGAKIKGAKFENSKVKGTPLDTSAPATVTVDPTLVADPTVVAPTTPTVDNTTPVPPPASEVVVTPPTTDPVTPPTNINTDPAPTVVTAEPNPVPAVVQTPGQVETAIDDLLNSIIATELQVTIMREDQFTAQDQVAILDEKIESLRKTLAPQDDTYSNLINKRSLLLLQIKEASLEKDASKVSELNINLQQVKDQLAELLKSRTELRTQIASAITERAETIAKLAEVNAAIKMQNTNLKDLAAQRTAQIKVLKELILAEGSVVEKTRLVAKVRDLYPQYSKQNFLDAYNAATADINSKKAEVLTIKGKRDELQTKVNEVVADIKAIRAQVTELNISISEINKVLSGLHVEMRNTTDVIERLKIQNKIISETNSRIEIAIQVRKLNLDADEKNDGLMDPRRDIVRLNSKMTAINRQISKLGQQRTYFQIGYYNTK